MLIRTRDHRKTHKNRLLTALALCALATTLAGQTASYTYDAAGRLSSVAYPNGKTLAYTYDPAGNLLRRLVSTPGTGPVPTATAAGVVNAASFQGGPVAPGELVTIFGTAIGPTTLAGYQITAYNYFDSLAGNTTVLFDGIPAPLIYASAGQTTAIVPYSVAGQSSTQMVVVYQGQTSAPTTVPVAAAAPALFSANSSGKGNGAILNQDSSVNSPANPAAKGSVVVLFGTGEGQTNPAGASGRIALTVFPKPVLPVKVTIGGIDATVAYAGAAPSLVSGVFQINATVPPGVASGAAAVVVTVGTVSSQPGLTVAVQ
jgi:uncharacterized protein (TIGR03437 family)